MDEDLDKMIHGQAEMMKGVIQGVEGLMGMIEKAFAGSKGRIMMIEGILQEREGQTGMRAMVNQGDHLGVGDQCLQKSIGIGVDMNPASHRGHLEVQHVDTSSVTDAASRSVDPDSLVKMNATAEALEAKEKQKPSFELSGKLAEETNRVAGVNLLHSEPPEARKSDIRWRLYVFKGGEPLDEPLYVHRMSSYLFGRERKVADIPTDHPSCSKQHAVLQYRLVEKEQPDGMMSKQVRPYLMDLGSTNGTFINENRIEPSRYYELFEKDTIKFGNSSREYVLLHENSKD
uniref:FHA domain-containing protein n=2 Tax=Oryza glumipatula TaxID=40148 RepID=A0A0E0A2A8_9ORYZ